jgi:hypothetical protein
MKERMLDVTSPETTTLPLSPGSINKKGVTKQNSKTIVFMKQDHHQQSFDKPLSIL